MKTGSELFEHTVLIVDDEELNRQMLANILQGEYNLLIATDEREALEKIRSEKDNLSLVLLDLLMPNLITVQKLFVPVFVILLSFLKMQSSFMQQNLISLLTCTALIISLSILQNSTLFIRIP